ncbi:hypothetical protein BASA81_005660 [Batrachochytrium salamandrivorans]|nr:hypothetical protein BASA81_005660 [Batrachochytrium salamandrivorans]
MSVVLPNTPVSLLALALEALDDIALSVFGDRYAESSTVFCGSGGRSWRHAPSGDPVLEREWSEDMISKRLQGRISRMW